MNLPDAVRLARLAKSRLVSPDDYLRFQDFQGDLVARYLKSRQVAIDGSLVLDVACGLGGFGQAFSRHGARSLSLDAFVEPRAGLDTFVRADSRHIPFPADRFDIVLSASLIEHVEVPAQLLRELGRVTRPGGSIYLSFPPFYSPLGGHQFSPFHLLGERWALMAYRFFRPLAGLDWIEEDYSVDPSGYSDSHGKWGLYRRTIREVRTLIRQTDLVISDQSTRWIPINLSRLPVLGEVLTWHVQFLLQKPH